MAAVKLPGSANSPYDVIQSKFKDVKLLLGRQFEQDDNALRAQKLPAQAYQAKSAELNAHYNKLLSTQTFEHRSQVQELNRIKSSVGRGETSGQSAYQAGWKLVLSNEAYQARFPTLSKASGEQAKPLSASALRSASVMMSEFVESSEEKRGLEWGKPKRTQASMIEKYMDWRAQSGYDSMESNLHKNQLDLQWDALMRSDKVYKDWFADEKKGKPIAEVASLRSKGRLGKAMSKKFVPRQYGSGRPGSVSPIGASFKKNLGAQAKKDVSNTDQSAPSAEELKKKAASETDPANRKKYYDQGVKLGYWG